MMIDDRPVLLRWDRHLRPQACGRGTAGGHMRTGGAGRERTASLVKMKEDLERRLRKNRAAASMLQMKELLITIDTCCGRGDFGEGRFSTSANPA